MYQGCIDCSDDGQWATAPRQIYPGVSVARALIPPRALDIPVRAFNVNVQPVRLAALTIVAQLDQVDACGVIASEAPAGSENERLEAITRKVGKVDSEVSDRDKNRLMELLLEFSAAFSL